jgi:ABC-type glycerol-3-phosphate transport system permease component
MMNQTEALAKMVQSGGSGAASEMAQTLTPLALRYTVTIVVILPILLVYPFFQRYFTGGIMIGAVKG